MIICGAFEGWLVMQSSIRAKRRKFFLIDPLSKAKIHLPVTATAINDTVNQQTVPVPALFAVHLSSAPISNDGANNNNCVAVGISMTNNLYLCKLGDQSWTRQDFIEAQHFRFEEIIFHNGSFIAIDCWAWGQVWILELVLESDHHLKVRAKMHSLPLPVFGDPDDEDNVHAFDSYRNLIEWRGDLYFVFHEMRGQKEETVALHVFKLDKLEPRWNLVKVENIGNGAIFLVTTVPKCFSMKDFPPSLNLKGNCIYHKRYLLRSTNVFHIGDGKWEPCPSLSSVQTKEDPFLWYAPKIRY
ncbi:hypothetical protein AAC387_Pa03g0250 [Persea americana]